MHYFLHKQAIYLSLALLVASALLTSKVFALETPLSNTTNAILPPTHPTQPVPTPREAGVMNTVLPTRPVYTPPMHPEEPTGYQPLAPHETTNASTSSFTLENDGHVSAGTPAAIHSVAPTHAPAFTPVHLEGTKLQTCEKLSSAISSRSANLVTLVYKQQRTFTSIAEGVENYYLTKIATSSAGLSNPNSIGASYDTLVATITTDQTAVTSSLQAAQSDLSNFTCTGNNPAAQLTQFRTDMQAALSALQTYRSAIKSLITAILAINNQQPNPTDSSHASGSAAINH